MTKRDRQASEYATESYEKGDEIRTNSTTMRDTTPAVGSVQGECSVRDNKRLRDEIERLRGNSSVGVSATGAESGSTPDAQGFGRSKDSPCQPFDSAPTTDQERFVRFQSAVMNWISEATGFLHDDVLRTDDARDVITNACMRCWDAFDRISYPSTNHDAAPAARVSAESVAPQPTASDKSGNPTSHSGTGKQPAPPCVEADGFSPGSSSDPINRNAERESPRRECGESLLRDVARPDTKGKVAGGPEPLFISVLPVSYAKTNAERVDYAVNRDTKQPRNGAVDDLSDRSKPVKGCVSDRSKPINDNRLSALEELSAMDQELELQHGITGNPMIKARRNKESAGAGITDAGPRLRQMNDVLKENERLRGQLAWTERERDSLRVSINNLRDYVAELNAESYAETDQNRIFYDTKRDTTQPQNGALSGCETVPDPDSRVWETPRTPQPHATPPQGSVQGEGSFRDSRNAKEPVAWAVEVGGELEASFCGRAGREDAADWREQSDGVIVPLYRLTPFTLTDEEREAIQWAIDALVSIANFFPKAVSADASAAATLRGLLDRTKGEKR